MLINLNIDLLRAFVTVAELKSFTRAADLLFRTQPTISLQIKRLETLTGGELLRRDSRTVELTPLGQTVFEYATRILALHDEMRTTIERREPEVEVIRIGTPDDYAHTLLASVLEAFNHWAPHVEIAITSDVSTKLSQQVRDGELDFAIITVPDGSESSSSTLRREKLHWVCGADQDILARKPLPLALFNEGCVFRKRAIDALTSANQPWVIAHSSNSFMGLLAALRSGRAISVLAEASIGPDLMVLGAETGLPDLGSVPIDIEVGTARRSKSCEVLRHTILTVLGRPDHEPELEAEAEFVPMAAGPAA